MTTKRPKRSISISDVAFVRLTEDLPKLPNGHVRGRRWDRAINAALDDAEGPQPIFN
jgi:hypothetical protein